MRSAKMVRLLPVCLLMLAFSGCTYIKSLFPDKERDYQFRNEIPDLIIPDDLKPQAAAKSKFPGQRPTQNAAVAPSHAPEISPSQSQPEVEKKSVLVKPVPVEPSEASTSKTPVQVEVSSAEVSSLQIDQPKMQAWRLVSKALGRERIEIVERNLDKTYFIIKYDPKATKPQDESIWDELDFLFGEDPSNEQEYRISLLEIGPQLSEVTVQDTTGKTLSNDPATRLLKLITDGINADSQSPKETEVKAAP